MIALAADCLIFELATGESTPVSAEMIAVEVVGETAGLFDSDFVQNTSHAVFHYFKHELGRDRVSIAEFTSALEKVLKSFALTAKTPKVPADSKVLESDLRRLVSETGKYCELLFFPRLREELRVKLREAPNVVRFLGLRQCVKQLVGAQRWSLRCSNLENQIVGFLRECLAAENSQAQLALVVR